jgi:ubiquinone/menaquinone biosynthesis C-methylase UbiE
LGGALVLTDTHTHEWTEPETITAWRTWGTSFAAYTRPFTDLLVQAANVAQGMRVLDLASGVGEPALALARAVGTTGHVLATDVSDGMLEVLRVAAAEQGLPNITIRSASAESLPFTSGSFDRVTSRLGVMHVAQPSAALAEARRVLKPGGRAAFLVWGPPGEQTMMLHQAILARHVQTAPPSSEAPGPFRFARPGTLSAAMLTAGFEDVAESTYRLALAWSGTPEDWWQQTREIAAPLRHLLASLPPAERAQIDQEVYAALREHSYAGQVRLEAVVRVASGQAHP